MYLVLNKQSRNKKSQKFAHRKQNKKPFEMKKLKNGNDQ